MSPRAIGGLALGGWLCAAIALGGWAYDAGRDLVVEMTPSQVNDVRESRVARVTSSHSGRRFVVYKVRPR